MPGQLTIKKKTTNRKFVVLVHPSSISLVRSSDAYNKHCTIIKAVTFTKGSDPVIYSSY